MFRSMCLCVCVRGTGLFRAVADVSVFNDHSAPSVGEAPALHQGVCYEEEEEEEFAPWSRMYHETLKTPIYYIFFLCCAVKRVIMCHCIDLKT